MGEYLMGVGVDERFSTIISLFSSLLLLQQLSETIFAFTLEMLLPLHKLPVIAGGDGLSTVRLIQSILELLTETPVILQLLFLARKLQSGLTLPPTCLILSQFMLVFSLFLIDKRQEGHLCCTTFFFCVIGQQFPS